MTYRPLAYFAALILFFAPANATTLYKCDLKGVVTSSEDGNIAPMPDHWMKTVTPMTIDVVSGVVRFGENQNVTRWRIVAKGSAINDWILVRDIPAHEQDTGRHDDSVIRVRDWEEQSMEAGPTVVYYEFGTFHTGACKGLD